MEFTFALFYESYTALHQALKVKDYQNEFLHLGFLGMYFFAFNQK